MDLWIIYSIVVIHGVLSFSLKSLEAYNNYVKGTMKYCLSMHILFELDAILCWFTVVFHI